MARKNIKPLYLSYPRRISRIFTPYEQIELFEIIPTTVVQIIYVNPLGKAENQANVRKISIFLGRSYFAENRTNDICISDDSCCYECKYRYRLKEKFSFPVKSITRLCYGFYYI